ncbi:MAG: DUF1214 domain-containing protein [Pseudomonadota bacterium]
MTPFIKVLIFLGIGSALGYFSAHWIIAGDVGPLTIRNSGWTLWSKAGLHDADPYTKAHFALRGELPLSGFEEMTFKASADEAGVELNTGCRYLLSSPPVPSRAWSLTASRPTGEPFTVASRRTSFSRDNIVRLRNGNFRVEVSATASPGNWLPISVDDANFILTLSMFNPDREIIEDPARAKLPVIKQINCR